MFGLSRLFGRKVEKATTRRASPTTSARSSRTDHTTTQTPLIVPVGDTSPARSKSNSDSSGLSDSGSSSSYDGGGSSFGGGGFGGGGGGGGGAAFAPPKL
mgnify:CR=1 FL=1